MVERFLLVVLYAGCAAPFVALALRGVVDADLRWAGNGGYALAVLAYLVLRWLWRRGGNDGGGLRG